MVGTETVAIIIVGGTIAAAPTSVAEHHNQKREGGVPGLASKQDIVVAGTATPMSVAIHNTSAIMTAHVESVVDASQLIIVGATGAELKCGGP